MSTTDTPAALMAWHYTTTDRLPSIKASGGLWPATAGVSETERPVTWFSLDQHFEPTAAKGLRDPVTGEQRAATIAEMVQMCGGLVRFGVPPRALLTGEELRRKARISNSVWRRLCAAGAGCGANPSHWFGSIGPMDVADCTVQHLNPVTGAWEAH